MKKPLRDEKDLFVSFSQGKLRTWGADDVDILIEATNKALENEDDEEKAFISPEDGFCIIVHDWLEMFAEDAMTEEAVQDLNDILSDLRFIHALIPSEDGPPYWRYVADFRLRA